MIGSALDFGSLFASRIISRFALNVTVTSIITLGAMQSRAIYTSRELQRRNPSFHDQLVRLGNLDLLYMLVEEITRPFEDATHLYHTNKYAFNEVTDELIKLV